MSGEAKKYTLRVEGSPSIFHQIFFAVVVKQAVNGLFSPNGTAMLSQQTFENRVCSCCPLNTHGCSKRKTDNGIRMRISDREKVGKFFEAASCVNHVVFHIPQNK